MRYLLLALAIFLLPAAAPVRAAEYQISVTADHDLHNAPAKVTLQLPAAEAQAETATLKSDGGSLVAQLTDPSLLNDTQADGGKVVRELHFIVPELKQGATASYRVTLGGNPDEATKFTWSHAGDQYAELSYGGKPVLRYMHAPLDEKNREETYKVFHHVYSPSGEQIVTKGAGGRYTHHRGLFYGFNRCTFGDGKRADIWHCSGSTHQAHQEFLSEETGPVLGRHRLLIHWNSSPEHMFAVEQREMTVYAVPGGHLIEFASQLQSKDGKLTVDGDPQHAGFHFRAANEVAEKTKGQTYYVRPDGKDKPGATRNWPGQKDHVNLPFNGMSFVVGGQRYTAGYLDRPQNPKEARFSERDYGRFGSYFKHEIADDETLDVNYRIWLQEGELDAKKLAELDRNFTNPPQVKVK